MRKFQDLQIWQRSHLLTLRIYKTTKLYPKEEQYGLTSQMRRSASSIPTNIAEGCGRGTNPDFVRFLVIAMGSSSELEYQLILSRDLEYITQEEYNPLSNELIEIRKMMNTYIQKLS
jgi:four helix bundle protein